MVRAARTTSLRRSLGTPSAVLLGLGSILGTGVFLSLGLAASVSGARVLPALGVAALLALFNGLSSAQLAAAHPVSGGTYAYGYRFLSPTHGFAAGWLFLCAKSASAATAALALAGAIEASARVPTAIAAIGALTLLALAGIDRSAKANSVIVGFTLLSLVVFSLVTSHAGWADPATAVAALTHAPGNPGAEHFLYACALLFVAFTGYGRIATLGEEVREPARTIPRAILWSLAVSLAVYLLVATSAIVAVGAERYGALAAETSAPLPAIARAIGSPETALLVSAGAVTALTSVILNLVLGLSRVVLAMGRSGDLPPVFSRVRGGVPVPAVLAAGALIGALALVGNATTTWSFSAFMVLVYYGITHWASLRLPRERRLFPRWTAWAGLAGCFFLAFQVPVAVWVSGCAVLAAGLGARAFYRML